jgi:hypothetical protein
MNMAMNMNMNIKINLTMNMKKTMNMKHEHELSYDRPYLCLFVQQDFKNKKNTSR